MVWGSMSSKGVGKLHFIDGNAIKWMEENNVPLLKWVSSSPDLSPIETL
ncbi:unnamed protein product [Acanthoscelides obtectus]|uniref:Uncharacterized protein n=1 Tax=Acanthoscelides obtectus TaxID=200917 RepID=A0A9P0QDU4_ACAOB|nr:unnamed protein product [Acanthoscelides obtectus]CAH2018129.1 unnamed protein product [Acanthoscelides obtectus]CAK1646898.1 hypothetical protein AOBTE_LOCUS14928 [Acanthoscelides obtectus]CAK1684828.1 hypothetical protein AOBTE_LOCUS35142 [Acanthoscelides obtectus]